MNILIFWKFSKIHEIWWFSSILVNFDEMYSTVHAYPTPNATWGGSRTRSGCWGFVSGRVRMPWIVQKRIRTDLTTFIFRRKSWFSENSWKSLIIHDFGSVWLRRVISSSLVLRLSRRLARPQGAASAAPDTQTHVTTCPQCHLSDPEGSRDSITDD